MPKLNRHQWALVALVVLGAAFRLAYIARPIYTDEAFTYLYFIRNGLGDVLTNYLEPNNHVFQTIFAWMSVTLFGNTPWALRIPALIAGVWLIPATYQAGARLYGRPSAGLISAALVTVCVPLAEYAVSARGYSFVSLFFVWHVILAHDIIHEGGTWRRWLAYGLIAALGLYSVPIMLYPLGAVSLWLLVRLLMARDWQAVGRMMAALTFGAVLTVALYLPIIIHNGLQLLVRNRFVLPLSPEEFRQTLDSFPLDFVRYVGQGLPDVVAVGLVLVALLALARREGRGLVLATAAWLALLVAVQYVVPPIRTWIFLVVLYALMFGAGVDWLIQRLQRETWTEAVALVVALGLGVWLVSVEAMHNTVTYRREDDAQAAAQYIAPRLQPDDWILLTNGAIHNYEYELDREGANFSQIVLSMDNALAVQTAIDHTLYVLTRVGDDYIENRLRESIGVDISADNVTLELLVTLPADEIVIQQLVFHDDN